MVPQVCAFSVHHEHCFSIASAAALAVPTARDWASGRKFDGALDVLDAQEAFLRN